MMDRSRDADDKVNKASKAAKFVKKGAKESFSRSDSPRRFTGARERRERRPNAPDLTPTRRERDG